MSNISSDDRFIKQLPEFQPHWMNWRMSVQEYEKVYYSKNNLTKFVKTTNITDDLLVVCYFSCLDGMLISHRVGGPANYMYDYKTHRLQYMCFKLFNEDISEKDYWDELKHRFPLYDEIRHPYYQGRKKIYALPITPSVSKMRTVNRQTFYKYIELTGDIDIKINHS